MTNADVRETQDSEAVKRKIMEAIQKDVKETGWPPTFDEFSKSSGISKSTVKRHFGKWNNAIRFAGFQPGKPSYWIDENEMLIDWGETVRRMDRDLSKTEYNREGGYCGETLARRFGEWRNVPEKFRALAAGQEEWQDVIEILDRGTENNKINRKPKFRNRQLYSNQMNWRWLRHEPMNEIGVVFLFGLLAPRLGYMVEVIQASFPDCEAKKRIAEGQWQRMRIEFEYESRNFKAHGHDPTGCDMIVCWRHNWKNHPQTLEILELRTMFNCEHREII